MIYDEAEVRNVFNKLVVDENSEDLKLAINHSQNAKFGETCIRLVLPPSKSGGASLTVDEGVNLMGAKKLFFWAKGVSGKEKIVVGLGSINGDSFYKKKAVPLTKFWKKYQLDFANADLRRIGTGFFWQLDGGQAGIEVYLDRISIE